MTFRTSSNPHAALNHQNPDQLLSPQLLAQLERLAGCKGSVAAEYRTSKFKAKMLIALAILPVLLWFGLDKLGLSGIIAVVGGLALTWIVFALCSIPFFYFIALLALVDAGLVVVVFGSDIHIH